MADGQQIDKQFSDLVAAMAAASEARAESLLGRRRPAWPKYYDKCNSRKEMLALLNRRELNERYKQTLEQAREKTVGDATVIEAQYGFVAGVARDLYHTRRPRLARLFARAGLAEGYGGDYGVVRQVVLGHVQRLVEKGTAE